MNYEFLSKLSRRLTTTIAIAGLTLGSALLVTGCEPETPPPQQPLPGEATTDHMDRQTDRAHDDARLRQDERLGNEEPMDDQRGVREDDRENNREDNREDNRIDPPGISV